MQNVLNLWSVWPLQRRLGLVAAILLSFGVVLAIGRMAAQPSMELLYAGLDQAAAGQVVSALDARGVQYQVEGGAIYVPAQQRDVLRMSLAAEGMPANGTRGYELLDSLSGFGTTAQMFDAAYWRAKEGELGRTIMASPIVRGARVHIANPPSNPFQRGVRPTASVTVQTATGVLSIDQARAFQYLVGSAVAGLAPEDVAIIDSESGMVDTNPDISSAALGEERAVALKERAMRLLDARLGAGNSVVELSVATVTDTEEIVERRFNPDERVAISSETESRTSQAQEEGAAGVTVASNLPEGDVGAEDRSNRQENETREMINYEVSETRREVRRVPGDIARITVAVLVNGTTDADGAFLPRSAEELEALAALVSSAIGLNVERGDELTIRSMPLATTEGEPGVAAPVGFASNLDLMSLIQLGALVVVALVLSLFVLRPLLLRPSAALALPGGATTSNLALAGGAEDEPHSEAAPELENDPMLDFELPQLQVVGDIDMSDIPDGDGSFDLPDLSDFEDDPVMRLKEMIKHRPRETLELLRSWIDEDER